MKEFIQQGYYICAGFSSYCVRSYLVLYPISRDIGPRGKQSLEWHNDQVKQVKAFHSLVSNTFVGEKEISGRHCMTGASLSIDALDEYAFDIDGAYRSELPAGQYDLIVVRGLEYEIVKRTVDIKSDP